MLWGCSATSTVVYDFKPQAETLPCEYLYRSVTSRLVFKVVPVQ